MIGTPKGLLIILEESSLIQKIVCNDFWGDLKEGHLFTNLKGTSPAEQKMISEMWSDFKQQGFLFNREICFYFDDCSRVICFSGLKSSGGLYYLFGYRLEAQRCSGFESPQASLFQTMILGFMHAMNNPLAIAYGLNEVVEKKIDSEIPNSVTEELRMRLQKQRDSFNRMKALLNDLRFYIQEGSRPNNLGLDLILEKSVLIFSPYFKNKGLVLSCDLRAENKDIIMGPMDFEFIMWSALNLFCDLQGGQGIPLSTIVIHSFYDEKCCYVSLTDSSCQDYNKVFKQSQPPDIYRCHEGFCRFLLFLNHQKSSLSVSKQGAFIVLTLSFPLDSN